MGLETHRRRRHLHLGPLTNYIRTMEPRSSRLRNQDAFKGRRCDPTGWLQAGGRAQGHNTRMEILTGLGFRSTLQTIQELLRYQSRQSRACTPWLELGQGRVWKGGAVLQCRESTSVRGPLHRDFQYQPGGQKRGCRGLFPPSRRR